MSISRPDLAPPADCKYPDANVLVHGFTTPIPRIPENAKTVMEREGMYFHTLNPRNYMQAWFADDVAKMTLRIERCARIERRERDRIVLRAEFFWDDDRRLDAEEHGSRLAADPARTVERLRRTPQGCDWLMKRWAWLAREADRVSAWTEPQTALAFDLLGTPADFRTGPPGLSLDDVGRPVASDDADADPDLASVARREIAALRDRRLAVADSDALDRALAMADMAEQSTLELRRLRRYENTLHKRMRWSLHQLQVEPRHHAPNPSLRYLYEPEPTPEPEPEPVVPTPIPEPEPEPAPLTLKPSPPTRRPDPVVLKQERRRAAKKRRADRLDN